MLLKEKVPGSGVEGETSSLLQCIIASIFPGRAFAFPS